MKKTVKIISLIVAMLILMPAIVSCQSDKTSTSMKNKFVGEWVNYRSSKYASEMYTIFTFFDDGTFEYRSYSDNVLTVQLEGTYSTDGDKMVAHFDIGIKDEHIVYKGAGQNAYIEDSEGNRYDKKS